MATIDERIVSAVFENDKFERNIAQTMASMQKFNQALDNAGKHTAFSDLDKTASKVTFQGPMSALDKFRARLSGVGSGASRGMSEIQNAGNRVSLNKPIEALDRVESKTAQMGNKADRSFSEISRAAGRVSLGNLSGALDHVSHRFSILQGAAAVALGNITSRAIMTGTNVVKALTLTPVMEGFHNYETQINAVQTILANTGLKGSSGLRQVNSVLSELNTYANKTVYNFADMAKNIGTFTAAGVKLRPATDAIKGIANLGAMSGSNAQQVSTAMYQLSQALAAGQVHLQDWNSVVNAGMGGQVFQKALMQTAEAMGTIEKGAYKVDKATGKATINGEAFRQSIQSKPGQTSWLTSDVLTKTLQQFTGDMTDAQLAAEGFSKSQIKAIQAQAKTAVGAATQIKTVTQLFQALKEEVGTAWGAVFKTIFGDINQAKNLLSPLHTAIENALTNPIYALNRVLEGWSKMGGRKTLIDALHQGVKDLGLVLKPVVAAFHDIFPPTTGNTLVRLTNGFAKLMDALKPSVPTIANLYRTFRGVFAILHIGVTVIEDVIKLVGRLVSSASKGSGGILAFTGSLGDFLMHLDHVLIKGGALHRFFDDLYNVLKGPLKFLGDVAKAIGGLFDGGTGAAAKSVTDGMHSVTDAATPLHHALGQLRDDWDAFVKVLGRVREKAGPVLNEVSDAFAKVGDAIGTAFSDQNFSKTSAAIQTAFAGGIFLVLRKAILGGVTSFGQTLASPIKSLNQVLGGLTSHLKAMQQNVKAKTLLEIAGAIGILAAGVYVLSTVKPARLAGALTAMAVGLGELMASMRIMTGGSFGGKGAFTMTTIAASLVVLSSAVVILAGAMKIFASMSWKDLQRGFAGLTGSLTVLAAATKLIPPTFVMQAGSILIMAGALNVLGVAMKIFASMSWTQIAKGLAGILGSLTAIAAVSDSLGPGLLVAGPGLILVSTGLTILAAAVTAMGRQSVGTLAKGILGLSTALLAIGVAIQAIPPTAGLQAVGLTILAAALVGIAVAVKAFGSMSLETLAKGFIAIGLAIVELAAGLSMMTGTLPGAAALLVAAGALAILAPALGFMGALQWSTILKGLIAMAAVLGTLAVVGALAAPGLSALGIALLPLAATFTVAAAGVFLLAKALALLGGEGQKGIAVMVTAITAFIAMIPHIIIGFIQGVVTTFDMLSTVAPKVVNALDKMLTVAIAFIVREAPKLAVAIGSLVDALILVLGRNGPKLMDAGLTLLENLLRGVSKHIGKIVDIGATVVRRFINAISRNIPGLANAGARMIISFLSGVERIYQRVVTTGVTLAGKFIRAVARALVRLADVGAQAVIDFLNGLAAVIRRRAPQLRHAGANLASAIIEGFTGGLTAGKAWGAIKHAAGGLFHGVIRLANDIFKRKSPSKVFHEIGTDVSQGLANGITAGGVHAENSATDVGNRVTKAMKKSIGHIPMALGDMKEFNPKITPILDLSHVRKHAGELGQLTSSPKVTPTTSNDHALTILRQLSAAEKARAETEVGKVSKHDKPSSVTFVQHNHSPKSLSTAEIYRRTGNQISKIRNELGLTHGGPAVVMQ